MEQVAFGFQLISPGQVWSKNFPFKWFRAPSVKATARGGVSDRKGLLVSQGRGLGLVCETLELKFREMRPVRRKVLQMRCAIREPYWFSHSDVHFFAALIRLLPMNCKFYSAPPVQKPFSLGCISISPLLLLYTACVQTQSLQPTSSRRGYSFYCMIFNSDQLRRGSARCNETERLSKKC